MTAREMFEMLGYILIRNDEYYIDYYRRSIMYYTDKTIIFDKENRTYKVVGDSRFCQYVDVYEFQAIHQQMIELGWIDNG